MNNRLLTQIIKTIALCPVSELRSLGTKVRLEFFLHGVTNRVNLEENYRAQAARHHHGN
jgi:hypothetical protein